MKFTIRVRLFSKRLKCKRRFAAAYARNNDRLLQIVGSEHENKGFRSPFRHHLRLMNLQRRGEGLPPVPPNETVGETALRRSREYHERPKWRRWHWWK